MKISNHLKNVDASLFLMAVFELHMLHSDSANSHIGAETKFCIQRWLNWFPRMEIAVKQIATITYLQGSYLHKHWLRKWFGIVHVINNFLMIV